MDPPRETCIILLQNNVSDLMDVFIQFVINHWPLWLAFVVLVAMVIRLESRSNVRGVELVGPHMAVNLINREDAIVIDVRDRSAFEKGHIINAKHIPFKEIEDNIQKFNDAKSKPIIINGTQDQQATQAGVLLKQKGFEHVHTLKGGVTAWKEASLPLLVA